jgi:uncharacterized protein (UPF0335 family)
MTFTREAFTQYAEEVRTRKEGLAEERGRVNQIFKRVEESGGHKKAMRDALRLAELEIAKRGDYLASLQTYCDWLGIWAPPSLFDEAQPRRVVPANAEEEELPLAAQNWSEDEVEAGLDPEMADYEPEEPAAEYEPQEATPQTIATATEIGHEDGKLNRSPEQGPYAEGEPLRIHYDRAWLAGRREQIEADEQAAARGSKRPARPQKRGFRPDAPADVALRRTRQRGARGAATLPDLTNEYTPELPAGE